MPLATRMVARNVSPRRRLSCLNVASAIPLHPDRREVGSLQKVPTSGFGVLGGRRSSTGRRRDHMALTIVGQALLFDRWPSQGIVSVAKLLARGMGARSAFRTWRSAAA